MSKRVWHSYPVTCERCGHVTTYGLFRETPFTDVEIATGKKYHKCAACENLRRGRTIGDINVVNWIGPYWWVLKVTGKDYSYTPLYEGQGSTELERRTDYARWLKRLR